jgi:oxygen-independent coproporphyrinogen-3 oxidase
VKRELRQQYADALCREMAMRTTGDTISTAYLGGGTPSQLTIGQLQQLFDALYNIYKVADNAEVTIEVNPDDVTAELATELAQLPVNRVSMGVQTFDNERLRFLRRRHTSEQAIQAFSRLRKAGFNNISIDLMYGFPEETAADWQHDIDAAIALGAEHVSAYCLSIEEGTPLHRMNIEAADEETERAMYYTLIDRLDAAGYEHYEISNFARPGYRSRHNSSYWTDIPYIGLGAAAHSYDGRYRRWNPSDLQLYVNSIHDGRLTSEQEFIDDVTHYNDRITTALRTCDGLNLATLPDRFSNYCLQEAQPFLRNGLLRLEDNHLTLTRQGLFVSDMVMSSLMMV